VKSLVDPDLIDSLYQASQSGVQIDLIVRESAVCGRVSRFVENNTVRSIVERFLEHSRIFYFIMMDWAICSVECGTGCSEILTVD
jgi:polyphosphate kinase